MNKKFKTYICQYARSILHNAIIRGFGIQKLSFNNNFSFLQNVKVIPASTNNIINKEIFKKSQLVGILEYFKSIHNIDVCSCNYILNQLSNHFKDFNKSIKIKKDLVIFKLDFNNKEDYINNWVFLLSHVQENKSLTLQQIQKDVSNDPNIMGMFFKEIYKKNNTGGLYSANENTAIMFINKNQFNDDIICHQIIHYFQDITGRSVPKNIFFDTNFKTYDLIKDQKLIPAIFNARQIVPYAHNIAYVFQRHRS